MPFRKALGFQQPQARQLKPFWEEPASPALYDWVDEEAILVDQSRLDQGVAKQKLPVMMTSSPGCCFSVRTSLTGSPARIVEFSTPGPSRLRR
jgi:hypothetical protein